MQNAKEIKAPVNTLVVVCIAMVSVGIIIAVWFWYDARIGRMEKHIYDSRDRNEQVLLQEK